MKELQSVLNIVSDGLKTLAKGVEAIAEKVDEAAKSQGAVTPKRKKSSAATKKVKTVKKPVREHFPAFSTIFELERSMDEI